MTKFREQIASMRGKNVLVVGDAIHDATLHVVDSAPSVERPLGKVYKLSQRLTTFPGGAANAAANVTSLGGVAHLHTFVNNPFLSKAIHRSVDKFCLAACKGPNPIKVRVGDDRYDFFDGPTEIARDEIARICGSILGMRTVDAILLSDYGRGALHPDILHAVGVLARYSECPVVLDPKHQLYAELGDELVALTPNREEYTRLGGLRGIRKFYPGDGVTVAVTQGEAGCMLVASDGWVTPVPSFHAVAVDACGAGDSFAAALALALAGGAVIQEAAVLANAAGAAAVQQSGTVRVTPSQMLATLSGIPLTEASEGDEK